MIEIEDSKVEKMSDYAEKMLKYGGKLMQCIEEISRAEAAWDSVMITMTMTTSMTTWDSVADRRLWKSWRYGGYGNRGGGYGNRYGGDMGQRREYRERKIPRYR